MNLPSWKNTPLPATANARADDDYSSNLTADGLDLLAHVFVANICIATMQARGWEQVSGQKGFYPVNGFSLIGLEWTAFAVGNVGVVVSNDRTYYQAAFAMLEQGEAA